MSTPLSRILFFFLVLILVVALPWWLGIVILLAITIYLPFYLEVIFFGFLIDLLYSSTLNFPYVGLSVATVVLSSILFIKTQIRR